MKRRLVAIVVLVAIQALVVGIWYVIEAGRDADVGPELPQTLASERTTPMNVATPELAIRRRDGRNVRLVEMQGRPMILHFWATWCPPCRAELPALLDYAAQSDIPVLAVSVDPDWATVRAFIGRDPPPAVVLADGRVIERALSVQALPVTFVVDSVGRLRLRLDGPRDWGSASFLAAVRVAADL